MSNSAGIVGGYEKLLYPKTMDRYAMEKWSEAPWAIRAGGEIKLYCRPNRHQWFFRKV